MSSILPGRHATAVLVVAAPAFELTETLLSPLQDGSSSSELGLIAAHQGQFTVSVLCGMVSVLLYAAGFLGLANVCFARVPRLSRFAGWAAVVSMTGFFGVRGIQAVQLAMVDQGLDRQTGGQILDGAFANPLGALVLVLFLGGALVGTVALAVATWRAGLPRVPAVMLGGFQLVDLAAPGHAGAILAHAVLLAALTWFAVALWSPSHSPERSHDLEEHVLS